MTMRVGHMSGKFEIIHDPDPDGGLVGPFISQDVDWTLYHGCFTPGTIISNANGEKFKVSGAVGTRQELVKLLPDGKTEKQVPYYKRVQMLRKMRNANASAQ
jgi:hypothetical protein